MTSQTPIEHYTLDDYRQWEGDWELIQGIPLAMTPSPTIEHQRLGGHIHYQLLTALDTCPACEALFEIDVELAKDTVVRPTATGADAKRSKAVRTRSAGTAAER